MSWLANSPGTGTHTADGGTVAATAAFYGSGEATGTVAVTVVAVARLGRVRLGVGEPRRGRRRRKVVHGPHR